MPRSAWKWPCLQRDCGPAATPGSVAGSTLHIPFPKHWTSKVCTSVSAGLCIQKILIKLLCLVYFSVFTQVLVRLRPVFAHYLPWLGQLWEARIAGQGSGKRNATGNILGENREGRKMKRVSKYERDKVGTGKIWKDADTAKTVELSLGSVLKNKPPNSHIT